MLVRIVAVLVLAAFTYGGYRIYSSAKFQQLLEPSPQDRENPLDFLKNLPDPAVKPPAKKSGSRRKRKALRQVGTAPVASGKEVASEADLPPNQVPNREVATVLMQILAAKKLASGVSVAVTDDEVILMGEVSPEAREEILRIVEKARESRRINARNLTASKTES